MINSGIEKADDSVTRETIHTIKISKDVAAGAVFVFSCAAFFVGVLFLWQPAAFEQLFLHFINNPVRIVGLLMSFVISLLFIFKLNNKYIRKVNRKLKQRKGKR